MEKKKIDKKDAPVVGKPQEFYRYIKPNMSLSVVLEFGPDDSYTFHTTCIGFKDNHYLIIEVPNKTVEELMMRKVENSNAIVRGISDTELGHVIAFKSSVLTQITRPFCLMFLRVPTTFAIKAIREHERYKLSLSAVIMVNKIMYHGTMVDFSVSGCGIYLEDGGELCKDMEVKVESALNRFYPSDQQYTIVSIRKHKKGYLIGIQFKTQILVGHDLKKELLEQAFLLGTL